MTSPVYRQNPEVIVNVKPDGGACFCRPGKSRGIILDPLLFAIWSAADERTLLEIAEATQVSTYLASCVLTVLQLAELLSSEKSIRVNKARPPAPVPTEISIHAVVIHQYAPADLDNCLSTLANQTPFVPSVTVITTVPVALKSKNIRVIQSESGKLTDDLVNQLVSVKQEAILVLDSQVALAPHALDEMLYALHLRSDIAAVAPRVMWKQWRRFVMSMGDWRSADDVRNNPYAGQLDVGQFGPRWQEIPAINFSAGLIRREIFHKIAVPDADYDLDWIGVDWCYRARLRGYHILSSTQALAYGPWLAPVDLVQETKNKLTFVTRNFEPEFTHKQIQTYQHQDRLRSETEQEACHLGWKRFRENRVTPRQITNRPPRSDEWLNSLEPSGPGAMLQDSIPALTVDNVRAVYSQYQTVTPLQIKKRVAFIGQKTARHQKMARQLDSVCDIARIEIQENDDEASLIQTISAADLVIATTEAMQRFGSLQRWHKPIILDAQPPVTLATRTEGAYNTSLCKQVEAFADTPQLWLQTIDGVVCASEEERLYWLGQFAARDRISPYTAQGDPALRDLVMVMPTGVDVPASSPQLILKGIHPKIHANDKVILWLGNLLPHDDPLTLIRGFAKLRPTHNNLKLIFAAFGDEPHDQKNQKLAIQLTIELELTRSVFFEQQISPSVHKSYLSEADLAIKLSTDSLEAQLHEPAELSMCIGAEVPLILTSGGASSGLVQRYELGRTVPSEDVETLAKTIINCLQTPREVYREHFEKAHAALAWSQVITPIAEFCQEPHYALDRQVNAFLYQKHVLPPPSPTPLWALPAKAWRMLTRKGLRSTIGEVLQYVRWKMGV